jgi:hypothetical protein
LSSAFDFFGGGNTPAPTAASLGLNPNDVYYQDSRATDDFGFEDGATGDYAY